MLEENSDKQQLYSCTTESTMHLLENYLHELTEIRSQGVPETSYYGPLGRLLDEVGKQLTPRVKCIINPKNIGAGIPDGGLFTPDQLPKVSGAEPLPRLLPSRGVIEAKPVGDDSWLTAKGSQVSKYWERYRQVLVTNFRDFLLRAYSSY